MIDFECFIFAERFYKFKVNWNVKWENQWEYIHHRIKVAVIGTYY